MKDAKMQYPMAGEGIEQRIDMMSGLADLDLADEGVGILLVRPPESQTLLHQPRQPSSCRTLTPSTAIVEAPNRIEAVGQRLGPCT
jgi:hypothetical protein